MSTSRPIDAGFLERAHVSAAVDHVGLRRAELFSVWVHLGDVGLDAAAAVDRRLDMDGRRMFSAETEVCGWIGSFIPGRQDHGRAQHA
jgi:hypothetical protein